MKRGEALVVGWTNISFATLEPDNDLLKEIGDRVWLMDNHKWALSVWAHTHTGTRRRLLHADHHWDSVDLFHGDPQEQAALNAADLAELDRRIADEDRVQYDAFIAPAIRRHYFDQVHFYCTQKDDWDRGFSTELCTSFDVQQTLHDSVDSFAALPAKEATAFDLCLDLFNDAHKKVYDSELWPEARIQAFLDATSHLVAAADVVTVSLSFGYSGTEDDTRYLAKLVMPQLLASRNTAK